MKKTNVTEFEFGKIVEEIPASKFDCATMHIYLTNISDDAIAYLREYVGRLPDEKLLSCMVHWNGRVETLYHFGEEYLVY